jgi:hypothetical protein
MRELTELPRSLDPFHLMAILYDIEFDMERDQGCMIMLM